ncbi:MAG: response regulator [Bacteroidia bacterium]|nr:response regulator [Bacteroidia bacterium]MCC7533102.1 response regulator [Bacteroidia bacterium]MCZ2140918.1 response regulator [Bacteroidia bacterium]
MPTNNIAAKKILLIDDDELILKVMNRILTKEGYNVIAVNNGKDALEKIEAEKYDMVITDLMMPYSNGFEIISKFKQHPNALNVPIIVISSVGTESAIKEGLNIGADDYIRKPIMPDELLIRIKRLIKE